MNIHQRSSLDELNLTGDVCLKLNVLLWFSTDHAQIFSAALHKPHYVQGTLGVSHMTIFRTIAIGDRYSDPYSGITRYRDFLKHFSSFWQSFLILPFFKADITENIRRCLTATA